METETKKEVQPQQNNIDPKEILKEWKESSEGVNFLFGAGQVVLIGISIILLLAALVSLVMMTTIPTGKNQVFAKDHVEYLFGCLRCAVIFFALSGVVYSWPVLGGLRKANLCNWLKQKGLDSHAVAGEVLKLISMEECCKLAGSYFTFKRMLQSPQILGDAAFFNANPREKKRYFISLWIFTLGRIIRRILFIIVALSFLNGWEALTLRSIRLDDSSIMSFENVAVLLIEMPLFWVVIIVAITITVIVNVCESQTKKARAAWLYNNFKK